MTSSLDISVCGDLTYVADWEGDMIAADWTLPGITYDSASREFAIFSEDISLVGLKTITV